MTEHEWLASTNPAAMLRLYTSDEMPWPHGTPAPLVSDRKLRLFACACCRQAWDLLDPLSRRVIETAERFVDGQATKEETFRLASSCMTVVRCLMPTWDESEEANAVVEIANMHNRAILPAYAALLRCICGNPWRPVVLPVEFRTVERKETRRMPPGARPMIPVSPTGKVQRREPFCPWLAWNGGTVRRLAEAVYSDNDYSEISLSVLADALEEAGCGGEACPKCHGSGTYTVQVRDQALSAANGYGMATTYSEWRGCRHCGGDHDRKGAGRVPNPLLTHLRGPGQHCRGCWAVDLLLGKE